MDKYTPTTENMTRDPPRLEIAARVGHKEIRKGAGKYSGEKSSPSVESSLVWVVCWGLWLNLPHLLVHAWLHMHRVLDVRGGRWLDLLLLLLLLLLLELLLSAIVVCCRRHRGRGGHGISGVRVHISSEIRVGQCFGGGDALGRVKLQQALQ
jgi:hypothetical protein